MINNTLFIDPLKTARSALDPAIHAAYFAATATGDLPARKRMDMRMMLLSCFSALVMGEAGAFNLKITGVVTEYLTGDLVDKALVRVYKDGVKQQAEETDLLGHYSFTLDNNARYVIRFSAPGHQTKCYTVDTHGLEWEGENRTKDLWVEMTLFQRIDEMDLSFFDLPMGQAHFEPATGLVTWDTDYDRRIREEVQSIMSEYQRRMTATADVRGTATR